MKIFMILLGIVAILGMGFIWTKVKNLDSRVPMPIDKTLNNQPVDEAPQTTIMAENLDTPWGMVFLPDNSILVTERPGKVRLIDRNGNLQSVPVADINNIQQIGEGGLLGIAIHPDFPINSYVYLYYTYNENNGDTLNRVVRMTYENKKLHNEQIIVDAIPGSSNHNGGRIKFGPDKYLYISTGDAGNPSQAQDTNTTGGKILRTTDTGDPAQGNPFQNLIYSYGHRNPQGLAWDMKGQLWITEHGRSGLLSGLDEINMIERGKNYGWPIIQGDEIQTGMEPPRLHSGTSSTWAPAGAAFIGNSLFFGGLRSKSLFEAKIDNKSIILKQYLTDQFGRIRDVLLGPDNLLYITTSNRDGRGDPTDSDDKIIRINHQKLSED